MLGRTAREAPGWRSFCEAPPMRRLPVTHFVLSLSTLLLFASAAQAQETQAAAPGGAILVVEAEVVIPPPPSAEVPPPPPQAPLAQAPQPMQPMQSAQSAQPYSLAAPQMRVEHRMNRGLAVAGGIMFGVSWGVNILGSGFGTLLLFAGSSTHAGLTGDETFGASFIPVVGPLIFAGVALDSDSGLGGFFATIGILDAAVQAAGLTMLIIGIVGEDVEVNASAENQLIVLPYASSQGAGLTASGTF